LLGGLLGEGNVGAVEGKCGSKERAYRNHRGRPFCARKDQGEHSFLGGLEQGVGVTV
jgi:hypothetical protein